MRERESKQKFKRRAISIHKELLTNEQYRAKREKHIKVRKREQEEKEANREIRDFKIEDC